MNSNNVPPTQRFVEVARSVPPARLGAVFHMTAGTANYKHKCPRASPPEGVCENRSVYGFTTGRYSIGSASADIMLAPDAVLSALPGAQRRYGRSRRASHWQRT